LSLPQLTISFIISFALLLIAMTAHEFAHGLAAYKLGDSTAKFSGRLTLNPLAHIDPFGLYSCRLYFFCPLPGILFLGLPNQFP